METKTTIKTIKLENHNTTINIVEMKEERKLESNVLWTNTPFKTKFFVTLDGEHIIKNQNDYCNQIGNEAYLNDVIENLIAIDGGDEDVNYCLKYGHEPIHWEEI